MSNPKPTPRKRSLELYDKVQKAYRSGSLVKEIAHDFNLSVSYVRQICKGMGIARKTERNAEMRKMRAAGYSFGDIGRKYGISRQGAEQAIKKSKW